MFSAFMRGEGKELSQRGRIEYIDALRGFTMLLVVFAHVEGFGFFNFSHQTMTNSFLSSFRMPLFFFISVFVAYKLEKCDCLWYARSVRKKMRIQLIPTLFFGLIYTYLYLGKDFSSFIADPAKLGYWFTIALLEMFLVYYTVNLIVKDRNKHEVIWFFSLVGIAISMYLLKLPFKYYPILKTIGNYSSLHYTFEYFQFFVFGLFASKYRNQFGHLLDNGTVMAVVMLLFSSLCYVKFNMVDILLQGKVDIWIIISTFLGTVIGYLGIVVVFCFFRKYQSSVSSSCRLGRTLQYVGRRTLDIYMIHYFLLPTLPGIGDFLKSSSNVIVELMLGFGLSVAIIGLCIMISNVIRTSDLLAYYLFGKKHS